MPSLKSLLVTVYDRSKDFLTSAGTVIVTLSIILWFLSAFPRVDFPPETSSIVQQQMQLEQSYAGSLGKIIEPIFAPLGFDWKLTIGIIGSFAAREVFVTVMGQLYATDTSLGDESLRQILYSSIPLASALSVLAFYVFALQCISTMAILKGNWVLEMASFCFCLYICISIYFCICNISNHTCPDSLIPFQLGMIETPTLFSSFNTEELNFDTSSIVIADTLSNNVKALLGLFQNIV